LETPSGDELTDILGPGKGDIYFGEGWTLGFQTTHRMGIACSQRDGEQNCTGSWELVTEEINTYQIIKRHNQYIYTTRDIENIIDDLEATIEDGEVDERGVHDLASNPLDNAFTFTFRTNDTPFEETWSLILSATEWTGNPDTEEPNVGNTTAIDANNIAAVEYGAFDGEDEKDARAVPRIASQFDMSFLDRAQVKFDRDTRPADGRLGHHWFFAISNPDGNVTIKYQPSKKLARSPDLRQYKVVRLVEFKSDGSIANTIDLTPEDAEFNPAKGQYDPVEAHTYTPADGETVRHCRLDVQKASFVATAFEKGTTGWKFLSVPITPERADPFVNLGDDIEPLKLYKYDTKLAGYKIYPLDLGEVGLQFGHGYFTRLSEDVEVDVGGASNNDDQTVELKDAGWHAIGNPFVKPVDVANLKINGVTFDNVSDDLIEKTLYRWKIDAGNSDAYEAIDSSGQLNPWDGCWLKTKSANLTLTIPAPDGLANYIAPLPPSFDPPMAPSSVMDLASHDKRVLKKGEFDLRFELTSDSSSDMITALGTRQNAKLGLDAYDQSEPPRLNHTVSAYFDHSDWSGGLGRYNTDYHEPLKIGKPQTWKVVVYTDKPKAEMKLSWEKAIENIPDDTMFYFRRLSEQSKTEEEWHDMRDVSSIKINSDSRITKVTLEIRVERFEMALPENLSVVPDEKQVTIKWTATDNPFIAGYTITRSAQHGTRNTQYAIPNTQHEFINTDVLEDATYTYQFSVHFKTGAELKSKKFTVTVLPSVKQTALLQSYPNPFNPETWIPYELDKESKVKIEIYNVSGQMVNILDIGTQARGRYVSKDKAAHWDGRTKFGERAASGVYFYILKAGDFVATRKMVILKVGYTETEFFGKARFLLKYLRHGALKALNNIFSRDGIVFGEQLDVVW